MGKSLFSVFCLACLLMAQSGCVSMRQYRDKEVEIAALKEEYRLMSDQGDKSAESLTKRATELQAENLKLSNEIEDKNKKIMSLNRDIEVLNISRTEEVNKVKTTYDNFVNDLKDEVSKGQIEIEQLKDKISVKMLDKILFNSGESQINELGKKTLSKLGESLKNLTDKKICVEGHTDNVKISSRLIEKYPTNWELSASRAVNVVRYLEEVVGINAQLLSAQAYGQNKPVAENNTPENRSKNRRIEIILLPLDK